MKDIWFRKSKVGLVPAKMSGWVLITVVLLTAILITYLYDTVSHSVRETTLMAYPYISFLLMTGLLIMYLTGERMDWLEARRRAIFPVPITWQGNLMLLLIITFFAYLLTVGSYNLSQGNILVEGIPSCIIIMLLIEVWLFFKTVKWLPDHA